MPEAEKKVPLKLKPLKYQDYKTKLSTTEKYIKGTPDALFENRSTLGCSDR